MNLKELKPGKLIENPETDLPDLLENILTRIQFVPNIRHALGWRGLVPSEKFHHTWTARVEGCKGIFGVYADEVETNRDSCAQVTYRIAYFPDASEAISQRFSSAATVYLLKPDFADSVREFASDLDMAALFEVGRMTFAVDQQGKSLALGLQGLSRRRVNIEDGYALPDGSGLLVSPGTLDEHLPAFNIAYQLFKVLAASISFGVGEAPSSLVRSIHKGWTYSKNSQGSWSQHPSEVVNFNDLRLGFGSIESTTMDFQCPVDTAVKSMLNWIGHEEPPELYANALWWHAHDLETLSVVDKRSLGIEDRPQLFVLCGFLGSGKTSFLQNFLEYQIQHHRYVAVIQNEVGEVSVDGKIIDDSYVITELNDGAVCCSLVGELRPSLQNILNNYNPDIIVLETSGVVNPLGLQEDIRSLEDLVRFDSITTIVDADQFQNSLNEYEVVADQVRAADVIVLNKVDLVSDEKLQNITASLRQFNPHVALLHASYGVINPGLVYDFGVTSNTVQIEDGITKGNVTLKHSHEHDKLRNLKIDCDSRIQTKDLVQILENVPASIFRIKGVIDLVGRGTTLVQFVGGRFNLSEFQNPNVAERFLVLIGHDLEPVALAIAAILKPGVSHPKSESIAV